MEPNDDATGGSRPEAIASLCERHAARVLDGLARRTRDPRRAAQLCAEVFAVALERVDGDDAADGATAEWLDAIATSLSERAERRGSVVARAQTRLGMAPLHLLGEVGGGDLSATAAGERFLRELEEELVEAARFRDARRPGRRPLRAFLLVGAGALLLLAVLAVLAVGRGGDEPQPARPPAGSLVLLGSMRRDTYCGGAAPGSEPWAREPRGLGVLERPQREGDALSAAALERLPLAGVDPALTRRGGSPAAAATVHIVPARAVPREAPCGRVALPGVCLVDARSRFRCFTVWEVGSGRALARSARGLIVGLVPDGVGAVALSARGREVRADVVDNVYEARLDVPAGTRVRITLAQAGRGPGPVDSAGARSSTG